MPSGTYDALPTPADAPASPSPHAAPYDRSASNSPAPGTPDELAPPQPRFLGAALGAERGGPSVRDSASSNFNSVRNSYAGSTSALSPDTRANTPASFNPYRDDPNSPGSGSPIPLNEKGSPVLPDKRTRFSRRRVYVIAAVVAVVVIIAIAVPVALATKHKSTAESRTSTSDTDPGDSGGGGGGSGGGGGGSGGGTKGAVVTGGDGSTVTMDDGTTFTYKNSFGGYWYYDDKDPFNNGARPQSWSPGLNETFTFGTDVIRGVNLGGWLVTEPFIVPALYEAYPDAVDEWTLSWAMGNDSANGGISQLETHYKTFITERDFAEIAAAGLNFVRLPIGYWAIETRDAEAFLAKTSWTYFLKAVKWARKYGLRINLDLHAVPGGQNPWNHSGRVGPTGLLHGPMGLANAQRALDYIRVIAEFIAQPQYADVVVMFGITNEPRAPTIGQENVGRYYLQAYNAVRGATANKLGTGPWVSFHTGFLALSAWKGFLKGADRIALDNHPYIAFNSPQPTAAMSSMTEVPCQYWASSVNTSMDAFGFTTAGEWSNAVTDCGKWLNGVTVASVYEKQVGSCDTLLDYDNWSDDYKKGLKGWALSSMDALQNSFFWTWKIGNSTATGKVTSPHWSYQLGLAGGWMPTDPRTATGACGYTDSWEGPLAVGNGQIAADQTASWAWPPTSISGAGGAPTALPTYTPTGTIATLPPPSVTATDAGDGWNNPADQTQMMVPIATCNYLDPWTTASKPPSPLCGGAARREAAPLVTAAPK